MIGNYNMVVPFDAETFTVGKTWREIRDALLQGNICTLQNGPVEFSGEIIYSYALINGATITSTLDGNKYQLGLIPEIDGAVLETDSPDGYPVMTPIGG